MTTLQKFRDNMPIIITIGLTVLISIIGIIALAATDKPKISDEEKQALLETDNSKIAGLSDSQITITEFSDFECPACAYYYSELEKTKGVYGDRVEFSFKHFPLTSIHPLAFKAAEASEAAAARGLFWEYHSILFERQAEWTSLNRETAIRKFTEYALEIGITDTEDFKKEIKDGVYTDIVASEKNDAEKLNLTGTPTIFLNGEKVPNPTQENLSILIEKELN